MRLLDIGAMVVGGAFILWQMDVVSPGGITSKRVTAPPPVLGKVTVLSDQMRPAPGEATSDFAEFGKTEPYFGAFALTKDGRSGYTFGYNSLEAAKADAVKFCTEKNSAPCDLYAVLEPSVSQTDLPVAMSVETRASYFEYLNGAKHGAFAVSDNGAYALTWDWPSPASAEAEALAICHSYSEDPEAADPAFTQCRVVASN